MGSASRRKPAFLAEKLKTIRETLRLSQDTIIPLLGLEGELARTEISSYERGRREPALHVILAYGDLAGVYVDVLINDNLDLPEKLPASPKSPGIPCPAAPKRPTPKPDS